MNRTAAQHLPTRRARLCRLNGWALLAILLWPLSNASAQPTGKQDWYQIEVILFAYEGSTANAGSEIWRDAFQFNYPRNLVILRNYVPPESLLQEVTIEHQPLPANTRLADAPNSADTPAGPDSWLRDPLARSETQPQKPRFDPLLMAPMDLGTDAFILLPRDQLQLRQTAIRIERAPDMRLLHHFAWRQGVSERQQSVPVLVQAGNQYGLEFELEGTLALSQNRFLHLDAELFFSQFERNLFSNSDWNAASAPPLGLNAANGIRWQPGASPLLQASEFVRQYTAALKQSQRIQNENLHYIDHPLFGVVVSVTPYEVPDRAMELPEFDPLQLPQRRPLPNAMQPVAPVTDARQPIN